METKSTPSDRDSLSLWYLSGYVWSVGDIVFSNDPIILQFCIPQRDRDHLKFLQSYFSMKGDISQHDITLRRRDSRSDYIQLILKDSDLCLQLMDMGCKINKRKIDHPFPKIKEDFLPLFVRGYFDGSGTISQGQLKFYGCRSFLKGLQTRLNKNLQITLSEQGVCVDDQGHLNYILGLGDVEQIQKIVDWMYEDIPNLLMREKRSALKSLVERRLSLVLQKQ